MPEPATQTASPIPPKDGGVTTTELVPYGSYRVTVHVLLSRVKNFKGSSKEQFLGSELEILMLPVGTPDASIAQQCLDAYNRVSAKVLGKIE